MFNITENSRKFSDWGKKKFDNLWKSQITTLILKAQGWEKSGKVDDDEGREGERFFLAVSFQNIFIQ